MEEQKHIYIIGIGGAGTIWIADWALAQGWRVSGSDVVESERTKALIAAGATIHYGSDPTAIPEDITEAIINSAITPGSPSYPELEELQRRTVPYMKRAEFIGKISRKNYAISVAGTHGKTTTTAMIGWILHEAGLDPTVFVGGTIAAWGQRTKIGKGRYLVLESDEFDRSFHHFSPQIAVILNIDLDHTDYYQGGIKEIEHSFRRFLRNLPENEGIVVGYGQDSHIRKAARGFKYRFRWYDEKHIWPGLHLMIPGKHNMLNATAAARVAHELGISHEVIKKALASFPGVGRRFEHIGHWNQVEVYDDYAHHPKEIAATLQAVKEYFKDKSVTLLFQPHQKARTKNLLKDFGRAFDQNPPAKLIIAPIYEVAGREEELNISNSDLLEEIHKQLPKGLEVIAPQDLADLQKEAKKASREGDILVSMGAGNIRNHIEEWMTQDRK